MPDSPNVRTPPQGPQQPGPQTILTAQRIEVTSQLLPSPQELSEYERIQPGTAERIFAMAEREQAERHRAQAYALETLRMDNVAERKAEERGQWMATIFLWGNLLAAVVLAILDLTLPACILGAASLANVLNTIITRTKN